MRDLEKRPSLTSEMYRKRLARKLLFAFALLSHEWSVFRNLVEACCLKIKVKISASESQKGHFLNQKVNTTMLKTIQSRWNCWKERLHIETKRALKIFALSGWAHCRRRMVGEVQRETGSKTGIRRGTYKAFQRYDCRRSEMVSKRTSWPFYCCKS